MMGTMDIPFPQMPQTRQVTQSVPEHEILLVFGGDEEASRFGDWLESSGWAAFTAWHREMEHDIVRHEDST